MTCPQCFSETKVIDSRPDIDCVHRKRRCIKCFFTFKTIEIENNLYEHIIKNKDEKNFKKLL